MHDWLEGGAFFCFLPMQRYLPWDTRRDCLQRNCGPLDELTEIFTRNHGLGMDLDEQHSSLPTPTSSPISPHVWGIYYTYITNSTSPTAPHSSAPPMSFGCDQRTVRHASACSFDYHQASSLVWSMYSTSGIFVPIYGWWIPPSKIFCHYLLCYLLYRADLLFCVYLTNIFPQRVLLLPLLFLYLHNFCSTNSLSYILPTMYFVF